MSCKSVTFYGSVPEDGTFSILARITSLDGTGEELAPGEGALLKQADVSAITCKVYDLGASRAAEAGTAITPDPTVTVSNVIFDTVRTVGWSEDPYGYNFRHDLAVDYVPNSDRWYLFEYKFTLLAGGTAWLRVKVKATATTQS